MAETVFDQLRQRRVPQLMGVYLGCAWGFVQFVDWMVKRYLLSTHLVDAVLVALISLAPVAFLLAFTHGAPGPNRWTRLEKVGIPANVLLTVLLLIFLFPGNDLGAASQTVVATDEEGQKVEREVPKAEARRRAIVFFFDASDLAADQQWLRYGLPYLLAEDMNQDPFASVISPFFGKNNGLFNRIRRAGYEDGLGLPVPLMRQLATSYNQPHFITGKIGREEDGFRVEIEIFATAEMARATTRHTLRGKDLANLIDPLTRWLKKALDVHTGGIRLAGDLPIVDRFSETPRAVQNFVEGLLAILLENDYSLAAEHFRSATSLDPSFALAHLNLSEALFQLGETESAKASVLSALQHEYKLTEIERFQAKGWRYLLEGQVEKRTALFEMWAELYPWDVRAYTTLAFTYIWAGNRLDDAIAAFERVFELEPAEDWVLRKIAELRVAQRDFDGALDDYRRYGEIHPGDPWTDHYLGRTLLAAGDLEAARPHFEKAHHLLNGVVSPPLALADLELREGQVAEAMARLEDAASAANTASQESSVLQDRIQLLQITGRLGEALDLMPAFIDAEKGYRQPIDQFITRMPFAELYVRQGRGAELEELLEEKKAQLGPPFDGFVDFGYLLLYEARDDLPKIEELASRLQEFFTVWKRDDLLYVPAKARAHALELSGDLEAAATAYGQTLVLFDSSISGGLGLTLREELLSRQASLLRRSGDLEGAKERLDEALRYFPYLPEANLEMAQWMRQEGRLEEARQHLDRARSMLANADAEAPLVAEVEGFELGPVAPP